ncbi:MAG: S8 family serine peptidase [Chloroflexi bacterium]|nr:S8 family serine peptidase [Chloroflexota bacterium]
MLPERDLGVDAIERARARLEPRLLALADQPDTEMPVDVVAISRRRLDLFAIDSRARQLTWPGGEHVSLIRLPAGRLLELAALPDLIEVWSGLPEDPSLGAVADTAPSGPSRAAGLVGSVAPERSRPSRAVSEGPRSAVAATEREAPPPEAWSMRMGGSAAGEAWALGYRGEGVRVGLLDEAVDFAHPDLQGTWALVPEGQPLAGWPQVFDPVAAYLLNSDNRTTEANRASRNARSGRIELYQRSEVVPREVDGQLRPTACFRALEWLNYQQTLGEPSCDYVVPEGSQSGVVRFGHHPDTLLRNLLADRDAGITGRAPGVLILDSREAGVYDQVYVDLDGDHDFSDEKPANKADPLSLRDLDGDGLADRSGGLLYFVSDGRSPYPGAWLFGMQDLIFPPGEVIGLLYAASDNGTAPASAIVAQGRLGLPEGYDLGFRDLPGQRPERMSLGLAPAAGLVSIGPLNYGRVAYEAGWRYGLYGHDPDREADDLQVLTYGYSSTFLEHDGWDFESRLMDHYLRLAGKPTLFVLGSGASGPGYGSNLGPMPVESLVVASGTHLGATGMDSINTTAQIAQGDVIPFSGAGPGTDGRSMPHLAADGAFSAGAMALNSVAGLGRDGSRSNQTWGGQRRAAAVASAAAALVYQAFRDRSGRWPSASEARAILMAGARFNGYDAFTSGAGSLDAGDAVRIAAGVSGLYAEPPLWAVGGEEHPGFTPRARRGERLSTRITLHNPGPEPLSLRIGGARPRRIGSIEASLTTTNTQESREPQVPDYLFPIDRSQVPEGTELLVVRGAMPLSDFDVSGNLRPDNHYTLGVLQHTDLDGDGQLWDDANGNGVVNSLPLSPVYVEADFGGLSRQMRALEATFTPPIDEQGVSGELALYGLACNDGDGNPEPPAQELTEKVALIERGSCTFHQKIGNALAAGAIAVIVYSDDRETTAMGSEEGDLDLPALMIDRQPGLSLRAALESGEPVSVTLRKRGTLRPWGLDGQRRVSYLDSEIEGQEFVRLNYDSTPRHHWAVPVHHPLERWSDGLYVALWHGRVSGVITQTRIGLRYDAYAWRDWPALSVERRQVTLPPGGSEVLEVALEIPDDAPFGPVQAALLIDYDRPEGEARVTGPGAWELAGQRLVVPIVGQVVADFDAGEALWLAGAGMRDADAPYDPAAVRGLWGWGQRGEPIDRGGGNEAGDWRFVFFEASGAKRDGHWLAYTRWQDPIPGGADVDTRIYRPALDDFSNPNSASESDAGLRLSDPQWYGPHGMAIAARSADQRVYATGKPFDTTTGANEDWFVLEAANGLHELALQTVRFSGSQLDMPLEAAIGAIRWTPEHIELRGAECSEIAVTSQLALPEFGAEAHGVSAPILERRVQARQDDPADRASASYRRDLWLDQPAAFFELRMAHTEGNNLDLILMYDADGDGSFQYPAERLAENYGGLAVELIARDGTQPAGHYQVWVYGQRVATEGVTFDLLIDVVSGDAIRLRGLPQRLEAGVPARFRACVEPGRAGGVAGPARGIIRFGPAAMPSVLTIPVAWQPGAPPPLYLPLSLGRSSSEGP